MRRLLALLLLSKLVLSQSLLSPEWSFSLSGNASGLAVSADAQYAVAGDSSGRATLLGAGGEELWGRSYAEPVGAVAISANGNAIAVAHGSTVSLLDKHGAVVWNATLESSVRALALSRDGTRVAAAAGSRVWLIESGNERWNYPAGVPIYALALSEQPPGVFGGSFDNFVYHWDAAGTLLEKFKIGSIIYALDASSDGSLISVGGADRRVYLMDSGGQLRWKHDTTDEVRALAMTPDGEFVLAGTGGGDAFLLDRDGELVLQYDAGERIGGAALSDDGRYFALAHSGFVDFFDARNYFEARLALALQRLNESRASGADLSRAEELLEAANYAMREDDYAGAMALAQAAEEAMDAEMARIRSRSESEIAESERALGAAQAEGLGFLVPEQMAKARDRLESARRLAGEGRYGEAIAEARAAREDATAASSTARLALVGCSGVFFLLFLLLIAWRVPAVLAFFSPSNILFMVEQALVLRDAGQTKIKLEVLRKQIAASRELGIAVDEEETRVKEIIERLAEGERLVRAHRLNEGQAQTRLARKELDLLLEQFRAKVEAKKAELEAKGREVRERAEEFRKKMEGQPPPA